MTYDFRKRSDDAKYFCDSVSLTKQEFRKDCNMNAIINKYNKNRISPHVITQFARYGDFSSIPSYDEALNYVLAAQQEFDALPAQLRYRFNNDPSELLAFIDDNANYNEAVELGLIEKKVDQTIVNLNVDQKKSEQTST